MKNLSSILNLKKNQIKIDSRDLKKGDIFLALKGSKDNGANYIEDAIKKGVKFVITESKKNYDDKRILRVSNCINILKKIAKYKRNKYKGVIIGITGSVGKTSTKEQLSFFLNKILKTYCSIKSYNNELGVNLSLANLDLKSKIAIFELGTNNFGEIAGLTSLVMPNIAIITNIAPTHLHNFKSIKNIAKEKKDIFLKNKKLKSIILPDNSLYSTYLVDEAKKNRKINLITFGKYKKSDVYVEEIKKINNLIISVKVKYKKDVILYKMSVLGQHQVQNSLIVISVFDLLNLSMSKFIKNSIKLPQISGRGKIHNIVLGRKKIKLIDESYNASPFSMKSTIQYFMNYKTKKFKKKFLIIGDMHELGSDEKIYHVRIKEYLDLDKIDYLITCGKLIKNLHISLKQSSNVFHFHNTNSILKFLTENIDNNDVVLVKGSNTSLANKLVREIQ